MEWSRAPAEKFSEGEQRKKDRKIALLSHFHGGGNGKKRPKNSTIKPLK